jgi:transposase
MTNSLPSYPDQPPRRKYTPEFKAKLVLASQQPNVSIAGIAQQYGINANLVHKWRHAAKQANQVQSMSVPAFVPVQSSSAITPQNTEATTVAFEVLLQGAVCKINWPLSHIRDAAAWLKALTS